MLKRGPQIVRDGLAPRHSGDDVVALGLVLRAKLADTRVPDRASRTVAIVTDLFERSIAAHPHKPAASGPSASTCWRARCPIPTALPK